MSWICLSPEQVLEVVATAAQPGGALARPSNWERCRYQMAPCFAGGSARILRGRASVAVGNTKQLLDIKQRRQRVGETLALSSN